MLRAGLFWLATTTSVAAAADEPAPIVPYPDSDPFYTDEYDRLDRCIFDLSKTYRFDYDRSDESAALQAANAVRRACAAEVAALRALVHAFEKSDNPAHIVGADLDARLVHPLYRAFRIFDLPWRNDGDETPGSSKLTPDYRVAFLSVADGFRPNEVVRISRSEAIYGPPDDTASGVFEYRGTIDGVPYTYTGSDTLWSGTVGAGSETAWVHCAHLPPDVTHRTWACFIELDTSSQSIGPYRAVLRMQAGKAQFRVREFCNPGDSVTDGFFDRHRPPPPEGSPREKARNATLILDAEAPIALPDGKKCLPDPTGALLKRVLKAKTVRTRYTPIFDMRTVDNDASTRLLKPVLELAAHLHKIVFDETAKSRMELNRRMLIQRTAPFTLQDALSQRPEWAGTKHCLLRAAKGAKPEQIDRAIDEAAASQCRDWMTDLIWRADHLSYDTEGPERSPRPAASTTNLIITAARAAAREPLKAPAPFSEHERDGSVMGERGRIGVGVAFRISAYSDLEEYGYVLTRDRATALIPATSARNEPNAIAPSLRIDCRPKRQHLCAIEIPTDDRKGVYTVHTNGTVHGAKLCITYPGLDAATWSLRRENGYAEETFAFDANGCIAKDAHHALIEIRARTTMLLMPPGDGDIDETRGVAQADLGFALGLAGYLADRLRG